MLCFLQFYILSFLFCGVLIAVDDVFVVLRWLCYITPFGYALRAVIFVIMKQTPDYEGAEYCQPMEILFPGTPGETICSPRGFYCPDDPMCVQHRSSHLRGQSNS